MNSDDDINDDKHEKLLSICKELTGKKRSKLIARKEPALNVDEFNLSKKTKSAKVARKNTLKTFALDKKTKLTLENKLKKLNRPPSILPAPLEEFEQKKIKQSVGYSKIKLDLDKWDSIVYQNRISNHMCFPLDNKEITIKNSEEVFNNFKTKSELERIFTNLTEENETPKMVNQSIENIKIKRGELAKMRAILSYREAKARRNKKIKSKNYHRLLKREKVNTFVKTFEELKKKNPEKALEKLEEMEKTRAKERMTLRHRTGGKWAQHHAIRAKFSKESRQILADQINMRRSLLKKPNEGDTSDSEEDENDFDNGKIDDVRPSLIDPVKNSNDSNETNVGFKSIDSFNKEKEPCVIHVNNQHPNDILNEDDSNEEEDELNMILGCFNDDDVIDEFKKEQEEIEKKKQPCDINLALPGWGSWSGKNLPIPKKHKKRLVLKFPKKNYTKSEQLILNDSKIDSFKKHQVNDLPFPFKNVSDFESSIRAPLGKDWIPESAHKKLIKPNVETMLGKIISPMEKNEVIEVENKLDVLLKKKNKKNKKKIKK